MLLSLTFWICDTPGRTHGQFRALEDGKLDLGFVGLHEPIARRGLEFQTIASYKTVAALPKDNPLAGKRRSR